MGIAKEKVRECILFWKYFYQDLGKAPMYKLITLLLEEVWTFDGECEEGVYLFSQEKWVDEIVLDNTGQVV